MTSIARYPFGNTRRRRPGSATTDSRWVEGPRADTLKTLWGVEKRDVIELDALSPEIPGEHPGGWYRELGERSIPLSPGSFWRVGEVPTSDLRAMLPASVGWVCRLVQRIGVVGDVAIEAGVNDAGVHVELGHQETGMP